VLHTAAKAFKIAAAERGRRKHYALMAKFPGTEAEIIARVKASRESGAAQANPLGIGVAARRKDRGRDRSGKEGKFEAGQKEIRNPYTGTPEYARVNIRHDVLEHMASRNRISDAEKAAGDRFVALVEQSNISGARAIDYGRPPVDGGGIADNLSATVMDATKELARIKGFLGETGYRILDHVLIRGFSIAQVAAQANGSPNTRTELYVGRRFKEALTDLAMLWGTRAPDAKAPAIVDGALIIAGRPRSGRAGVGIGWISENGQATDRPDIRDTTPTRESRRT
jgi:hypothetical protein